MSRFTNLIDNLKDKLNLILDNHILSKVFFGLGLIYIGILSRKLIKSVKRYIPISFKKIGNKLKKSYGSGPVVILSNQSYQVINKIISLFYQQYEGAFTINLIRLIDVDLTILKGDEKSIDVVSTSNVDINEFIINIKEVNFPKKFQSILTTFHKLSILILCIDYRVENYFDKLSNEQIENIVQYNFYLKILLLRLAMDSIVYNEKHKSLLIDLNNILCSQKYIFYSFVKECWNTFLRSTVMMPYTKQLDILCIEDGINYTTCLTKQEISLRESLFPVSSFSGNIFCKRVNNPLFYSQI